MVEKNRNGELHPERLLIPAELRPGTPVMELTGFSAVSVDGHRGIRHYSEERIDIMTRVGMVVVEGKALQLQKMDRDKIAVTGDLTCIRLERNDA